MLPLGALHHAKKFRKVWSKIRERFDPGEIAET